MRAIIPVAGVGTRLRPHTHTAPKVLVNVAGKPILGHIVDELVSLGVLDITFIVGYLAEQVVDYVNATWPEVRARFVEQKKREGLGHALWMTRNEFEAGESVLIILGDTIFQANLGAMISKGETAIAVKEVRDPRRFGVVETTGAGMITRLVEKPKNPTSNLAVVGIYTMRDVGILFDCLNELIENDRKTQGEYQLTDALQMMIDRGEPIRAVPIEGWLDCGKPETLLETNQLLLNQQSANDQALGDQFPDSIIIPPVFISSKARINHSIIGPYVSISDDADIFRSIISDSIISEGATVAKINLKDSIVAHNARVIGHRTRLNVGDSSEVVFE